jgi:hypothetical protein
MFPVTAQADTAIDVNRVLVDKLNAQGPKITSVASPGAGYTFQSASYGGNFGITPVKYLNLKVEPQDLTAASTFIGACFPANYTITSNVTASTDVGYTFSSETYLTTNTTLEANASYGGVANVKLTANVQTGQKESSNSSTQNLTANSATASMSKNLKCPNYDQPQFFQAVGSVTKNVWLDSINGSNKIRFYYYSFPTKSPAGIAYDAEFQATFSKPGSITQGPNFKIIFYDKNNKVLAEYDETTIGCQGNPNSCGHQIYGANDTKGFFSTDNYKNATKYNISFGGNPNNIGVRFNNRKGAWTNTYNTVNQQQALPNGYSGADLGSIELTNKDYITTNADTRVVTIPVNKVLVNVSSEGQPLPPDDQKFLVAGLFDSTTLNSIAMDVRYNMLSWDQLNKQGGYADLLSQCGGATLAEAKKNWKNACGSSKPTQPLKLNLIKK